ncbi:MAG: glucosidase [Bacteroidetes bacterium]|nr:glucosidase [Bacteroidota bacterium]
MSKVVTAEGKRLKDHYTGNKKWLKWGPYLSERQWATVREDYSPDGDAWNFLTHDMARSKTYRWGEDGLAGISDDRQRLCFALALWNGKDPFLKERLFGLTPRNGNHGEDVKELYYYLDNTPTHSYMKYLYKYPQAEFPYQKLEYENRHRSKYVDEFEIADTGIFRESNYFDIYIEYAKNNGDDICIRISAYNRSLQKAPLTLLPTLWLRNLYAFGLSQVQPFIELVKQGGQNYFVKVSGAGPEPYYFYFPKPGKVLFTNNETNTQRLYGKPNKDPFVKDAFHDAVVSNDFKIFEKVTRGTKFAPLYSYEIGGGDYLTLELRLSNQELLHPFDQNFGDIFSKRIAEADEFYDKLITTSNEDLKNIQRQAYAGMLWNKQYYYIDIPSWLNGDPGNPAPPEQRKQGRNSEWLTLNNEDILSMPDKWEYPWYASWDLPFHCITLANLDLQFAKDQMILLMREWYMNPYGQIPAYEWSFSDVNPPVQAWACMQIYKMEKEKSGSGDTLFLERVFQKLLINFTWWVNRKDRLNNNVFEGGFLGLDNIGVFDRNNIPANGTLEQADGTAWMGMYCLNMLEIALELAQFNSVYEDMATKFLEHFTYIAASINQIKEDFKGAWDEEEGFFYDVLKLEGGGFIPIKVRSLVGLTSLFAVHVIDKDVLKKLPDFYRRLKWFVRYRQKNKEYQVIENTGKKEKILLSLIPEQRLKKVLKALLDEKEFLSPGGIRSLSKLHEEPYRVLIDGKEFGLYYQPGDSHSSLFGGNSNWRGPVWMPMNYLIISAVEKYYSYFGNEWKTELPTGSSHYVGLDEVADELRCRLISIFSRSADNRRRVNGGVDLFDRDEQFKNLVLFYEFFHGDSAKGLGASHQTGWTGFIAEIIREQSFREKNKIVVKGKAGKK